MNFWQNTEYFFLLSLFIFSPLSFLCRVNHRASVFACISISHAREQFDSIEERSKVQIFHACLFENPDQFVIIKNISLVNRSFVIGQGCWIPRRNIESLILNPRRDKSFILFSRLNRDRIFRSFKATSVCKSHRNPYIYDPLAYHVSYAHYNTIFNLSIPLSLFLSISIYIYIYFKSLLLFQKETWNVAAKQPKPVRWWMVTFGDLERSKHRASAAYRKEVTQRQRSQHHVWSANVLERFRPYTSAGYSIIKNGIKFVLC